MLYKLLISIGFTCILGIACTSFAINHDVQYSMIDIKNIVLDNKGEYKLLNATIVFQDANFYALNLDVQYGNSDIISTMSYSLGRYFQRNDTIILIDNYNQTNIKLIKTNKALLVVQGFDFIKNKKYELNSYIDFNLRIEQILKNSNKSKCKRSNMEISIDNSIYKSKSGYTITFTGSIFELYYLNLRLISGSFVIQNQSIELIGKSGFHTTGNFTNGNVTFRGIPGVGSESIYFYK